eukprot:6524999-Pyramimonas_sp.AAC.1
MDTNTRFYYLPRAARECGWGNAPTVAMIVGCKKPYHGAAGGCAISSDNPCCYGVSGVVPHGTERELTNIIAAPSQNKDANEDSGEDDLVDIDAPPELDPDDAEVEAPISATERLKKSAASLSHLLTHTPNHPYRSVCNWAKAIRRQQRKTQHRRLRVSRPYANPTTFGHLTTDHTGSLACDG